MSAQNPMKNLGVVWWRTWISQVVTALHWFKVLSCWPAHSSYLWDIEWKNPSCRKKPSFSNEHNVSRPRVVPRFMVRHIHTQCLRSKKSLPHLCTATLTPSISWSSCASTFGISNTQSQQGHRYLHPVMYSCSPKHQEQNPAAFLLLTTPLPRTRCMNSHFSSFPPRSVTTLGSS